MYKMCNRCVMDTSDPFIIFDTNGYCNHCTQAIIKNEEINNNLLNNKKLNRVLDSVKESAVNRQYDCVVGISGGLDSSFLLYQVVQFGLRPLVVHVDNGWNSELAVQNIEKLVKGMNLDLITVVLNWDEFKEFQKAFLKASVVDIEMLSDNAIIVSLYRIMKKYKIKYSIYGYNYRSESIMPSNWLYQPKYDGLNIIDILRKNSNRKKAETYPIASYYEYISIGRMFKNGNFIPLLNYIEYDKEDALKLLKNKFDYTAYPYKHYESRITMFYQSYILPKKFQIDKRKAHFSSLICSNQMTRENALDLLKTEPFDRNYINIEKDFFLKKLDLTESVFNSIISQSRVDHLKYKSYSKFNLNHLIRFNHYLQIF